MNGYERCVQRFVDRKVDEDSNLGAALLEALSSIRKGRHDPYFIDFAVQRYQGRLDIYDAYVLSVLYDEWCNENLIIVRIPVGRGPGPDADREGNRNRLSNLPGSFKATVSDENCSTQDGNLYWDEPIILGGRTFQANSVPLEIGITKSSTTHEHVVWHGGVARWPYSSTDLILGVTVDPARGPRIVADKLMPKK